MAYFRITSTFIPSIDSLFNKAKLEIICNLTFLAI